MNKVRLQSFRRYPAAFAFAAASAVICGAGNSALGQTGIDLLASDGAASDYFGYSVAVSGNVAIVGTKLDDDKGTNSGSAYAYRWNGSQWVQEQKLFGSDEVAYDGFGASVAVDGNTAVVWAPNHYSNGSLTGAAYVLRWNGSSWLEEARLFPPRPTNISAGTPNGSCSSVSISGNVFVIGVPGDDEKGYDAGAVYVYERSGTSWIQKQKLTASDGLGGDVLGYSVAISGNVIVAGAYFADPKGSSSGAAYVFGLNGTSWVQKQKLVPTDGAANDIFGNAVSVSGDLIVVGAPLDGSRGLAFGSAYVYRFNGTSWLQETELFASDGASNRYFGSAVAVAGDAVVVGAYQGGPGRAYLFRKNGTTWTQESRLVDSNPATNDRFGYSVAVTVGRALVGAYSDTNVKGYAAGSAFVFEMGGTAPGCVTNADCNDSNPCTTDTCSAGACQHGNAPNGTVCTDDGNVCTTNSCQNGACQSANNTNTCSDGNACTVNDRCTNGTCGGTPMNCDDGKVCTTDSCNAGVCQYVFNTNNCNDNNPCSINDRCAAGVCSGTPMVCSDNNPCTNDTCSAGVCQYVQNTNSCSDGNPCTSGDRCAAGTCSGTPMNCNDNNPCTNDSCVAGVCQRINNVNACDDGDECTSADLCSSGACVGVEMDCDDDDECTDDSCSDGECEHVDNWVCLGDDPSCNLNGICEAGEDECTCPEDCGEGESDCTDDYDNDCDGLTDCYDPDCDADESCECRVRGEKCSRGSECCSGMCSRYRRCQ